jgi:hypothetical protein
MSGLLSAMATSIAPFAWPPSPCGPRLTDPSPGVSVRSSPILVEEVGGMIVSNSGAGKGARLERGIVAKEQ